MWGLCVAHSHRRQGIGRQLVELLVEHVSELPEVEQLHLEVLSCAEAAIELFNSLGFHCYCQEPHAVKDGGDYHDEWRMLKVLHSREADQEPAPSAE